MDRINVLHLIATMDIGGAERQLVELVRRMDKSKFNPVVCCLSRGGPLEGELKKAGIKYYIIGKRFKLDFSAIFKLITLMKREKVDILHTWMFTSNFFGRVAGILSGIPVIIASERCVDLWKNEFHLLIDRILSCFTDRIICVSEGVKGFYHRRAGISQHRLITIHGGIEIVEEPKVNVEGKKKEFGFEQDSIIVTTIGRLAPQKGIDYLLQAVPKVLKIYPKVKFLVIGKGPLDDRLRRVTEKLGISQYVIFGGERIDVRGILGMTDIFVLPSLFEGFPNVIMEAMLAKKPVIATRIPGNDELVVDGQTGILIPPKDADSLASSIVSILQNPEEGKEMGKRGKKRVEEYFSIDETVRKTEEIYEELYGGKKSLR